MLSPGAAVVGEPATVTVGAAELERLTGVRWERIRTWERRFGFPENTHRGRNSRRFAVADVARVLAVRQLIDAGEPVGVAMEIVKAGLPASNADALLSGFAGIAAPVTAWTGPEPLRLLWANDAARAAAVGGAIAAPDRSLLAYRTLQRMMVPNDGACALLEQRSLCDASPDPVRILTWTVGAPAFIPAIAVAMELPPAPPEPPVARARPRSMTDRRWVAAVAASRRALQRGPGPLAVDDAVAALRDCSGARDATIVHVRGDDLLPGRWSFGRLPKPVLGHTAARELRRISGGGMPDWLPPATAIELTTEPDAACLAVPLLLNGHCAGYLVLEFPERTSPSATVADLLLTLGVAIAASLGRDHAAAARRRALG